MLYTLLYSSLLLYSVYPFSSPTLRLECRRKRIATSLRFFLLFYFWVLLFSIFFSLLCLTLPFTIRHVSVSPLCVCVFACVQLVVCVFFFLCRRWKTQNIFRNWIRPQRENKSTRRENISCMVYGIVARELVISLVPPSNRQKWRWLFF